LQKPFPLLIRISVTSEAPENLNTAQEDLNAAPEGSETKFGNFFGKASKFQKLLQSLLWKHTSTVKNYVTYFS